MGYPIDLLPKLRDYNRAMESNLEKLKPKMETTELKREIEMVSVRLGKAQEYL